MSSRRRAFTLVELLVVIGIITVLIAILLPALSRAREQARQVACASNERQIYAACILFAQEHKGHLPRPTWHTTSPPHLPHVEALCAFAQDGPGQANLTVGGLWKYVQGEHARQGLILCPSDNGGPMAYGLTGERNFSYAFHAYVGDPADVDLGDLRIDSPERQRNGILPGVRITRIKNPSERVYIWEEIAPFDTWCVNPHRYHDRPSGRHGSRRAGELLSYGPYDPDDPRLRAGRGNHCFFDGHVESLSPAQILDYRSVTFPRGRPNYYLPIYE